MKLSTCHHCEQPLLRAHSVCPRCEMPNQSGRGWLWSIVAVAVIGTVTILGRLVAI